MPRGPGVRPGEPFPRAMRVGPYTIDAATDTRTAALGRVHARGGFGPELEAVCAACCEASYNAGDRRGGWSSRPLSPGEDVGCWLCGRAID